MKPSMPCRPFDDRAGDLVLRIAAVVLATVAAVTVCLISVGCRTLGGPETVSLFRPDSAVMEARGPATVKFYKRSVQKDPYNIDLRLELIKALVASGDLTGAYVEGIKAAAFDPSNPDPAFWIGNVLTRRGLYREALGWYRQAVDKRPAWKEAWLAQGQTALLAEDFPLAEKSFQTLLSLDPNNRGGIFNLALALHLSGRSEAAGLWRTYLTMDSSSPQSLQALVFLIREGVPPASSLVTPTGLSPEGFSLTGRMAPILTANRFLRLTVITPPGGESRRAGEFFRDDLVNRGVSRSAVEIREEESARVPLDFQITN